MLPNMQPLDQERTYRSVLIADSSANAAQDKRLVINDNFYQHKPSVFKRLGPTKPTNQDEAREANKRANVEPYRPSKRLSVDKSDSLFLAANVRKQSSIKVVYTPLDPSTLNKTRHNKSSLVEVTNKPSKISTRQSRMGPSTSENVCYHSNTNRRGDPSSSRAQSTNDSAPSSISNKLQPFKRIFQFKPWIFQWKMEYFSLYRLNEYSPSDESSDSSLGEREQETTLANTGESIQIQLLNIKPSIIEVDDELTPKASFHREAVISSHEVDMTTVVTINDNVTFHEEPSDIIVYRTSAQVAVIESVSTRMDNIGVPMRAADDFNESESNISTNSAKVGQSSDIDHNSIITNIPQ